MNLIKKLFGHNQDGAQPEPVENEELGEVVHGRIEHIQSGITKPVTHLHEVTTYIEDQLHTPPTPANAADKTADQ